jgi:predicted CXXCH cytochrome family protein
MLQGQKRSNMLGKKNENSFYFDHLVIVALSFFMVLFPVSVQAIVSGPCSDCHTMHNSQNGSPVAYDFDGVSFTPSETPKSNLLISSCLGCHSSTGTEALVNFPGGLTVPIVLNTSGYPTPALAGGNFYYTTQGGSDNDAKGHNILSDDSNLSAAPGNTSGCLASNSCHQNFHLPYTGSDPHDGDGMNIVGKYSCEGCHLRPKHHAYDHDHLQGGKVTTAAQGWYRFLSGHVPGLGYPNGVEGYEDGDWQYTSDTNDHNEYFAIENNGGTGLNPTSGVGHTVTGFCSGCHGTFRDQSGLNSPFIRHPADVVIDNTLEYANAFSAGGGGTGIYDPLIPVGKPGPVSGWSGPPSATVTLGTDMVMCLSCHRAHGSENFKMLRWDYRGWPGSGTNGCNVCHTSKD